MDNVVVGGSGVVLPGGGISILFFLVDFAGGHPVTEHLCYVVCRHFHATHAVVQIRVIVDPILQVMLISPLVVKPGGGDTGFQPLQLIGTAIAAEILGANQKFFGRIFGEIMEHPLLVETNFETVFPHQPLVGGDGFQMSQPFYHGMRPLSH